jgi:hypothetical protein
VQETGASAIVCCAGRLRRCSRCCWRGTRLVQWCAKGPSWTSRFGRRGCLRGGNGSTRAGGEDSDSEMDCVLLAAGCWLRDAGCVLRAALLIVRRGQWGGVRRGKGGFPEVNIR